MTTNAGDRLLFAEDVAALIGDLEGEPVQASTITFYASRSRRLQAVGKLTPYDMPLPDEYVDVDRPAGAKGPRKVSRPAWRESAIRAWRAALPGRRAEADRGRERTPTGQYVGQAS